MSLGLLTSDTCLLCNVVEDIPHMLYHCVYAKHIWDKLNMYGNLVISDVNVILGTNLNDKDILIVTFISYFIFKMWLKNSYENIPRNVSNLQHLLKIDLKRIHDIYECLHEQDLCTQLRHLLDIL